MNKLLYTFLVAMWFFNSNAQSSSPEIISSAGETFQGNAMQIDWTLGEMAITTIQNTSQQITQGFHQPNYTITSLNDLLQESGQIEVYPNPTADRIEIEINFDESRNVKIQLIDLNGRLIWTTENRGIRIKQIEDIKALSSGTYILIFTIEGFKNSQKFKIQKIK